MAFIKTLLSRHPFVVFFYLLLTGYNTWVTVIGCSNCAYAKTHPEVRGCGVGMLLPEIGMFLLGFIFCLVCGVAAIVRRSQSQFYLSAGVLALLQPIAFLQIMSLFE